MAGGYKDIASQSERGEGIGLCSFGRILLRDAMMMLCTLRFFFPSCLEGAGTGAVDKVASSADGCLCLGSNSMGHVYWKKWCCMQEMGLVEFE